MVAVNRLQLAQLHKKGNPDGDVKVTTVSITLQPVDLQPWWIYVSLFNCYRSEPAKYGMYSCYGGCWYLLHCISLTVVLLGFWIGLLIINFISNWIGSLLMAFTNKSGTVLYPTDKLSATLWERCYYKP
ncbi:hypothetical protein L1987_66004 [Smallanthus sonchifolius]|uniref:Uncharacterized protein n=1 Tax=Smallanthus sonchifolius TaxID=185202 RepID=A0ACB9BW65_9ASTR|nr:hypothetical protein L1987_66004 [Smallanthus sonchifolius]